MNRVKAKELALIAVATGLLTFEAIAVMGAAAVVGGVRHQVARPAVRLVTVTRENRSERVIERAMSRRARAIKASSTSECCTEEAVRNAVAAAVKAAL
jgi:hypothetical protein